MRPIRYRASPWQKSIRCSVGAGHGLFQHFLVFSAVAFAVVPFCFMLSGKKSETWVRAHIRIQRYGELADRRRRSGLGLSPGGLHARAGFRRAEIRLAARRVRHSAATATSKETSLSSPVSQPVDPTWWKAFHDPVLADLEQRVAAANLDIKTATIRIAEKSLPTRRRRRGRVADPQWDRPLSRELYSQNHIVSLLAPLAGGPPSRYCAVNDYTRRASTRPGSWTLQGRVLGQVGGRRCASRYCRRNKGAARSHPGGDGARLYSTARRAKPTQNRNGQSADRAGILQLSASASGQGPDDRLDVETPPRRSRRCAPKSPVSSSTWSGSTR